MSERRKHPRFPLQQPVRLRLREGRDYRDLRGTTVNASLRGAFLVTDAPITVGSEVELTIFLQQGVQICSRGKVIRVVHAYRQGTNGVAVECAHPFSELFCNA